MQFTDWSVQASKLPYCPESHFLFVEWKSRKPKQYIYTEQHV